jgi:C4-dicarboxylate-specific signal transduction histidine kinase
MPFGSNVDVGLVAVACERTDFPTETDQLLLSVAANHAATAFHIASLIQERRCAEEKLRQARDELEVRVTERTAELQRTMGELSNVSRVATAATLSASIAHETNQPLTAIVARASAARRWLTMENPDLEKALASLDAIKTASHRAGDIMTSMRATFTNDTTKISSIDINKLILTVLPIARLQLPMNDVELHTRLSEQLPPLKGDKVQLQQLILNLVTNAIEAMHSVERRVLRIESRLSKPEVVNVSVEDTGVGIDFPDYHSIFKSLFTTKERGMGMGLSICHSIIESHSGRIWASRRSDNRGSIFQFEIPTNIHTDILVP